MGWYPDPTDPTLERYWEGTRWTHNTRRPVAEPGWVSGLGDRQPVKRASGAARSEDAAAAVPTARQWDHTAMQWRELPIIDRVKRTEDGVTVASWWRRLLGRVVDDLLVAVVVAAVCFAQYREVWRELSAWWGPAYRDAQRGVANDGTALFEALSAHTTVIALVTVIITCTSAAFFHHRYGSTPGQMLVRVHVVPLGHGLHEGGLPLSTAIRRAAGYSIILTLNQLLWVVWVMDGLSALWSPTGQTIHDRFGRTQVVGRQGTPTG